MPYGAGLAALPDRDPTGTGWPRLWRRLLESEVPGPLRLCMLRGQDLGHFLSEPGACRLPLETGKRSQGFQLFAPQTGLHCV